MIERGERMNWVTRALVTLLLVSTAHAQAGVFKKKKQLGYSETTVEAWSVRPHGIKLRSFMEACDAGYTVACNEAAWLLETSLEVQNRARAESLLASHGTCAYDRRAFSQCVQEGRIVPSKRACELGNAAMCHLWGSSLSRLKRNPLESLVAFREACTLGHGASCRKGAAIIAYDDALPDADERLLRERGCALGEHTECWKLAKWHASGSHGYERDHGQYKVMMAESDRLEAVSENRWTEVRREIQQDALVRLDEARTLWATTLASNGSVYCMNHSTGRRQWVEGTLNGSTVVGWKGCKRTENGPSCVAGQGPAPQTMEVLFDQCARVLSASPATFEFGFGARPNGALSHCYSHAEGSEIRGQSVSTSNIHFGACR